MYSAWMDWFRVILALVFALYLICTLFRACRNHSYFVVHVYIMVELSVLFYIKCYLWFGA
jgi:hypothetical protein